MIAMIVGGGLVVVALLITVACGVAKAMDEDLSPRERVAANYECPVCSGQVFAADQFTGRCCGHRYYCDPDGRVWIDDQLASLFGAGC